MTWAEDKKQTQELYPVDKSLVFTYIQKKNWQLIIDSLKNYFSYLKDKDNKSKWTKVEKDAAASINQKLIYGDKKDGYFARYKITKIECKVMKDSVEKYRLDNNEMQHNKNKTKQIRQLVLDMRCDLIIATLNHWVKGTGGKNVNALDLGKKIPNTIREYETYPIYYPAKMPEPLNSELQEKAKKILNL